MLINKVEKLINEFLENNSFRSIYNEISLQFELGFFLKENLKNHNVEFERNINIQRKKLLIKKILPSMK